MSLNIAIIKLSAIGDIVMSVFVCEFIKQKYPKSNISWFVQKGFEDILEYNPFIDNINIIDIKNIKKNKFGLFSLIKNIKKYKTNKYDIVIDMQGLIKSAIVAKLINSKNSKIWGFGKNSTKEGLASFFYNQCVHIEYGQNIIKRNYTLINKALGLNISKKDIDNKNVSLFFKSNYSNTDIKLNILKNSKKSKECKNAKNILLLTGASLKNKIYKKENFAEVINNHQNKLYNFILIWSNENEKNIAVYLKHIAKYNNITFIANKLSLNELKELISKCNLIIGADSGPTHFSFALNMPSITLFGNTPAKRNTYITKINKSLYTKTNKNINPLKLDKNDFCINKIKPKKITKLIQKLLLKKN
jgi:heptosyltransferase-1